LGITNPTPLKNNLALEICMKRGSKRLVVIQLLVYNWFKNPESLFIYSQ
jgi:hypothetical protein